MHFGWFLPMIYEMYSTLKSKLTGPQKLILDPQFSILDS